VSHQSKKNSSALPGPLSVPELSSLDRRKLLQDSFAAMVALSAGPIVAACGGGGGGGGSNSGGPVEMRSNIANIGPLSETADINGVQLPDGFSCRIVAKTDQFPVSSSTYQWHYRPDGGATFPTSPGGWIYVSNSETENRGGGVGALEFDADGKLVDAFQLLSGTTNNCSGGATPWDTWLSCEETPRGAVWECYPLDPDRSAVRHSSLGIFQHEAAVIDPATGVVYLTEDRFDSGLYRFVPDIDGDLSAGVLQVAIAENVNAQGVAREGTITWEDVPDPGFLADIPLRKQVAGAAKFQRGEGAIFFAGTLFFATTFDTVIWAYEPSSGMLTQVYSPDLFNDTSLNGVDNIAVSSSGVLLVAEDSDDMQIQAITPDGKLIPLLKVTGHDPGGLLGELSGPAFDPSGTRLYFSSQRGTDEDYQVANRHIGVTYEITGPFVVPVDTKS